MNSPSVPHPSVLILICYIRDALLHNVWKTNQDCDSKNTESIYVLPPAFS